MLFESRESSNRHTPAGQAGVSERTRRPAAETARLFDEDEDALIDGISIDPLIDRWTARRCARR